METLQKVLIHQAYEKMDEAILRKARSIIIICNFEAKENDAGHDHSKIW